MATPTAAQALELMYRSSTVGASTQEFNNFGGYGAVQAIAEAAGYAPTGQFIASYEIANNLPESDSTKRNKTAASTAAATAAAAQQVAAQQAAAAESARALAAQQAAAQQAAAAEAARVLAAQQAATTTGTGIPGAPVASGGTIRTGTTTAVAQPLTNEAVRQAYLTVLGREPDAAGLKYFSDLFGAEVDAAELANFRTAAAPELAARTTAGATTTAGMSITQAYQKVLGRTPNAQEIAYWKTQFGDSVDAKELSTFSVAAQPELAAVPTTNNAVRQMYLSVLGREPDAAGLKYFSDRFGADVDASELGIFRGMSTQELAANAVRNAGTTAGATAGAINRPTTPTQVTGTQLAPAQVTNTAITGTPFTNIYQPANYQQNAPTLASIQSAAQSANPYQSLMAMSPQRTLSPSYAAQAGQTTANTNLGGYDSSLYSKSLTGLLAPSTVAGGGGTDLVNNSSGDYGGSNTGSGQTGYGTVANLAGEAQRYGFNNLGGLIAGAIPVGGTYNRTDLTTGLPVTGSFTTADLAALGNRDAIAAMTAQNQAIAQDAEQQSSSSGFDGNTGEGLGAAYDKFKGGLITPRNIRGPNPPGPDDGNTNIDIGEYVIRKSAVKKYGSNIFEQINAGKIPAQRLKSLLE